MGSEIPSTILVLTTTLEIPFNYFLGQSAFAVIRTSDSDLYCDGVQVLKTKQDAKSLKPQCDSAA
jgi:hypothetical protein